MYILRINVNTQNKTPTQLHMIHSSASSTLARFGDGGRADSDSGVCNADPTGPGVQYANSPQRYAFQLGASRWTLSPWMLPDFCFPTIPIFAGWKCFPVFFRASFSISFSCAPPAQPRVCFVHGLCSLVNGNINRFERLTTFLSIRIVDFLSLSRKQ